MPSIGDVALTCLTILHRDAGPDHPPPGTSPPPPSPSPARPTRGCEDGAMNVTLHTNLGDINITMFPDHAPKTVANFVGLAKGNLDYKDDAGRTSPTPYYDGLTFHRVIPGFMIQGGCPQGSGMGDGPRKLKAEFSKTRKHEKGVLSMARSQSPDSASCQFFVMHAASPHLDGQYSAFGKLVRGL